MQEEQKHTLFTQKGRIQEVLSDHHRKGGDEKTDVNTPKHISSKIYL